MKGYKEFGDTASMLAISRKLISNYREVVNLSQGSGYKQVQVVQASCSNIHS